MDEQLDDAIARIARAHHGIFGRHHLRLLDVSENWCAHRLATRRWERVHDSVYRLAGVPVTWHAELLAACWAGGTRAIASHGSAAKLWRLPAGRQEPLEILCPHWRRARHEGLVTHESLRIDDIDIAFVDGIPTTTVERTLFDLAASCKPWTLDLNVDAALRNELTTLDALRNARDRLAKRGREGSALFRRTIEDRLPHDAVPESAPERVLARSLESQGLPRPVTQYVINDEAGRFVARCDLAYPDARLVIEYDSYQHHVGKHALARDSARRNAITSLGFTVLTATARDVADRAVRLSAVVRRILAQAA